MKKTMLRWLPLLVLAVVIVGLVCFAPEANAYEFYGDYTDVSEIKDYGDCPSMQGLAVGSQYLYSVKINSDDTHAVIYMTDKDSGTTTKLYNSDNGSYYFTQLAHANDMDVWGIDGKSNIFVANTNKGANSVIRLQRDGNNLTQVANYRMTYNGSDICVTALAVKGYSNGKITFITKWGMDLYTGSVDASLSSATVEMTKFCTLVKSQSYIKDTYEDLSAYTNQGMGYHDGTIFLPLSALDIMDNRSVILLYNIDDALAGNGYYGKVYPIEHLNFRVTSGYYSALFEIESCDIGSDGKLYFNTNRRITNSDTNHDGVSSFDGYTYTKPTTQTTHYYIHYEANGGTGTMEDSYIPYGYATKTYANAFSRPGFTFAGWTAYRESDGKWIYVNSSGTDGWYTEGTQPSGYSLKVYNDACSVAKTSSTDGDIVHFYAQWTPGGQTYTIQYNANGGTGTMEDTLVAYGYTTNLRKNTFTRPGYTFAGWVAYRTTQDQWYYTDGTNSGWYAEGSQPAGYTLSVYRDEVGVAKTTAVDGDLCIFYAQWELTDPDYYLVGYINGADYGCEGDYENMGQYKFVDGKLVATFTQDSYVFVKITDNAAWYMTQSFVSGNSGTFYNTSTGAAEKMFVPGRQEITFTLKVNSDDTLSLSYTAVCSHSYTSEVTKAATCTATGIRTYTCSICGHSYTESIAATSHSYTSKVTAPTCTAGGYTTYTCTKCGDSYTGNNTSATGHTYDNGKVTTAATCIKTGVKTYTCTKCSATKTEAIPVVAHTYNAKVTSPTCTASGYTTYTCSVCGDSYTANPTAATGHSYKKVVTAPTCTAGGYTTYTCTKCGDSYKGDNTSATGHSYKSVVTAPTCTASGYTTYTCSKCNHSYTGNNTSATGHSYNNGVITTPATCTAAGVRTYTCTDCGATKTETISALGHNYSASITLPTCTTVGFTTHTCGKCGDRYTDSEVPMLSHNYDSVVTAPTCTTEGFTTHTCAACGDSYIDTKVPVAQHSYGVGRETVAPTCTKDGVLTYACINCGHTKTEAIDATGHDFVKGICTVCGAADPDYVKPDFFLVGYINGADYGCEGDAENVGEYRFVNGTLVATFETDSYVFIKTGDNADWFMFQTFCEADSGTLYNTTTGTSEKMYVPGGAELTFTLVENEDGSLTLSYEGEIPCKHPAHNQDGICADCGATVEHSFADGFCTCCGIADPNYVKPDFYLVGNINGADYGCEGDYENLGVYKFEDGALIATFETDSYVFIKTGDNRKWFMFESYCNTTSGTLYNTTTGTSEKM
ncbi:MAG: InlB B-repeat-containing protein, partial [Oscillospiraceae bacterium]|nr:InlB B-repeat-containing protein [Oscillospiraceae bacterium]